MTFTRNVSLRAHSSYKVGGPALFFAPVRTIPEVRAATNEARKRRLSIFILGGGTNLLIPDEGFEGLVLQPRFMALRRSGTTVRVGAGVSVKKLLELKETTTDPDQKRKIRQQLRKLDYRRYSEKEN